MQTTEIKGTGKNTTIFVDDPDEGMTSTLKVNEDGSITVKVVNMRSGDPKSDLTFTFEKEAAKHIRKLLR